MIPPEATAREQAEAAAARPSGPAPGAADPLGTPIKGAVDTVGEATFLIQQVAKTDPTYGPAALAVLAAWTKRRPAGAEVSPKELGELAGYLRGGLKAGGDRYAQVVYQAGGTLARTQNRAEDEQSILGQMKGFADRTMEDLGLKDDKTTPDKPVPWFSILAALGLAAVVAPNIGEAIGKARGK